MSAEYLVKLRQAHDAIGRLLRGVDWSSFDRCECGHLRVEHRNGAPPHGHQSCSHRKCGCDDFDGIHPDNPLRAA